MQIHTIQLLILLQVEIEKSFGLLDKIADPVLALLILFLFSASYALWKQVQYKTKHISVLYDEKFKILQDLQEDRAKEVGQLNANLLSISSSNQALIVEFKGLIREFTEKLKESNDLHRVNSKTIEQLGLKIDQIKNKRP